MKKFYLTTAIPYVNASPHIGHALEFLYGDVIARYQKMLGKKVLFLTGSDENALKNVQAAEKEHKEVQIFVDENAKKFQNLIKSLHVLVDVFQKGSDKKRHYPSSQKLWELCDKNGDIYQKKYQGLYCVGCEAFYEKEELNEKGECSEHPGKKLEKVSETNYFFKLSRYQKTLINLIVSDTIRIIPEKRKNEILSFLQKPLQDISISRSNKRARNWGVPVPGDPTQRIYVWFDALNIYQSGVGFGWDEKKYNTWWPADVHIVGKGITRFHAVYWPAFLLSAKLKLPKRLLVHEYITVEGQKMSKTIGNIIDPFALIDAYGVDPLRYYFLREISVFKDGDFSKRRFREVYNGDLANGLGNLIARVAKLAEKNKLFIKPEKRNITHERFSAYRDYMEQFRFNEALQYIHKKVKKEDVYINTVKLWKLEEKESRKHLIKIINTIIDSAYMLQPFIPETSEKIILQFQGKILYRSPLFPRM